MWFLGIAEELPKMPIRVGEFLPSAQMTIGSPGNKIDIRDYCRYKKTLLVGVVGAFTPTCNSQVPQIIAEADELKTNGVDQIACITVNDIFVCNEWARLLNFGDKLEILADEMGEFAQAIGITADNLVDLLGNVRSGRFLMLVVDNKVMEIAIEDDPAVMTCTGIQHAKAWV
ncbi:peroxiredoxin-5, mitochondrial-like [Symsagittifera roscoffensis]|uniref:peroxiredoxin-5, mitochondrial-like n=1 Tax=Symsagittifera roscoffensis TaxID=84072 RepID=UPI00307CA166